MLGRRPAVRFPLVVLGLARARSSHTDAERECLRRHARGKEQIVELGVEQGAGTAVLRAAMSPAGVLYAVDPHPRGRFGVSFPRLIARVEVSRATEGRVHWLRMTEGDAAGVIDELEPRGVGLVFSDCVFEYESLTREWDVWRERVGSGGIFIQSTSRPVPGRTHDDHDTVRFTRNVLLTDPDFECIETVDTFTVLARRPG